jgi:hypothetical protein
MVPGTPKGGIAVNEKLAFYVMIAYLMKGLEVTSKSRRIKLNKNYQQPLPVYGGVNTSLN